jgi:hypothetical protein
MKINSSTQLEDVPPACKNNEITASYSYFGAVILNSLVDLMNL